MEKDITDILTELDSKIPREEVSTRDAGRGRTLDYVSSYYVITQLNRIFGPHRWAYSSEIQKLHDGQITDTYGKATHVVHYAARVRLVVEFEPGVKTEFTDYGYGDGSDKVNPGKAHELAIKEAVTDGLKRCAKNLGNRLGLALYDKEQENVQDAEEPKPKYGSVNKTNETGQAVSELAEKMTEAALKQEKPVDRKALNAKITATAKVLIAQGKSSKENIQAIRKEKFSVDSTEDLSDTQAKEFLKQLEEKLNG